MRQAKHTLSEDDMEDLRKLLRTLAYFKKLSPSFPLSYMETLIHVALQQGKGTVDYARSLSLNKSSASRLLGIIGERPRRSNEHFALIEQHKNPTDARKTHYYITSRGHQILKGLIKEQRATRSAPRD